MEAFCFGVGSNLLPRNKDGSTLVIIDVFMVLEVDYFPVHRKKVLNETQNRMYGAAKIEAPKRSPSLQVLPLGDLNAQADKASQNTIYPRSNKHHTPRNTKLQALLKRVGRRSYKPVAIGAVSACLVPCALVSQLPGL